MWVPPFITEQSMHMKGHTIVRCATGHRLQQKELEIKSGGPPMLLWAFSPCACKQAQCVSPKQLRVESLSICHHKHGSSLSSPSPQPCTEGISIALMEEEMNEDRGVSGLPKVSEPEGAGRMGTFHKTVADSQRQGCRFPKARQLSQLVAC